MSSETIAKYVAKPATAFAVGGAIGAYARPGLTVPVFGTRVPAWAVAGAVCAIGSEFTALAHDYLWPHVTQLTLLNAPLNSAANVGINAAAGALTYNVLVPGALNEVGAAELIGAAALAEVISSYATELYWKPFIEQCMH